MFGEENSKAIQALPIKVFAFGRGFIAGAQAQRSLLVIDRLALSRSFERGVSGQGCRVVNAPLDRPCAEQRLQDRVWTERIDDADRVGHFERQCGPAKRVSA